MPVETPTQSEAADTRQDKCEHCADYRSRGGPRHDGSRFCESGSIASGGKRAHCSCDVCY